MDDEVQQRAQALWDAVCDTIADSKATNDIILCVLCTLAVDIAKQAKVTQDGLYQGMDHIWDTWDENTFH